MLHERHPLRAGDEYRIDGTNETVKIKATRSGAALYVERKGKRWYLVGSRCADFRRDHSVIEPAPAPTPVAETTPGQAAYNASRRRGHRAGISLSPRWHELDEAQREDWERCAAPKPVPEPMRALAADDSAQRFEAQAHAFAVKSGEDRELIKVLLRRLLRELEGGA